MADRAKESSGFIQQLSPRKKTKKGNEYYTFQWQTSPTSSQKVVSYQGDQYSFFKEMYSDKSPVKITSFQKDDHLQFSDRCRVTKLKGFDVPFDYAEVDACCSSSLSEEKPKVLKVNELKDIVSGTIVNNDSAFLKMDSREMKLITKLKVSVKEDCLLNDETGNFISYMGGTITIIYK